MKTLESKRPLLGLLPVFIAVLISMTVCSTAYCLDPPVVTPIDEFFVEHNGGDVQIAPPDWQLTVAGLVEQPLALTIEEIIEYPSQTHMGTIECGGNPFAFKVLDLIDNAIWTGVPVSTILEDAGVLDNASSVVFTGLDGYTVRVSLEDIYGRDDIMLAHGMNGETLPPEQGYPLRLTFPGVIGAMWAQWVTHVEVTSEELPQASRPVPAHCQIFTPEHEQAVDLGNQTIYGMAFAGGEEITAVEVSTDDGVSWQPATILTEYVPNVWRHWEFDWTPPAPGDYRLAARTITERGAVQEEGGVYGWRMFSIAITTECRLNVKHKKIFSEKLFKPRKVTLKITGDESFDPYGAIDVYPLEVLKVKIKPKKNALRVRALVPVGLEPQSIPISVGDCFGEIEIMQKNP